MKVVIVGAGLAGLSAAHALHARGVRDITVFERREGPGLETSFANGALLHPSLPEPWNSPGILRTLLRDLGKEDASALLRLHAVPSLMGWGLRFVRESSRPRFLANTRANLLLARYSVERMAAVPGPEPSAYARHATGSLMLFRERAAFEQGQQWARALAPDGRRFEVWSTAQAVAHEPALAPVAGDLAGVVFNPDDVRGDAHRYCVALAAWLEARGVRLAWGRSVTGLLPATAAASREVRGVRLADGEACPADAVVLAAASHSPALARATGLKLPVRPAKGYSLTLTPAVAPQALPKIAVVDEALHVAVVPVGDDRVRIAGTAEFTGHDLRLQPARIANLRRHFERVYPTLVRATPDAAAQPWTGLRPMVPDGVPLIGPTTVPGLFLNTGHGHLGWTQAAGSAALLADLMTGHTPDIDPTRYAPARFSL